MFWSHNNASSFQKDYKRNESINAKFNEILTSPEKVQCMNFWFNIIIRKKEYDEAGASIVQKNVHR